MPSANIACVLGSFRGGAAVGRQVVVGIVLQTTDAGGHAARGSFRLARLASHSAMNWGRTSTKNTLETGT